MLIKASLLWILLGVLGSAVSQERPLEAWWLRTEFSADHTTYEGIDISTLDPKWSKMTVLSYELLPAEAKNDISWMRKDGFEFVKEGHLGAKGFIDRAAVGVFEDHSGKGGRFLLVLRQDASGVWKKFFLHEDPGVRGFSVLTTKAGRVYWGTCMQCENFRRLVITARGAALN